MIQKKIQPTRISFLQLAMKMSADARGYGSGHETVAVLLPGFAINW